ncbi:hypothetical protein Afil01_47690 [Actinorhabdospora filicis]|uniref:Gram-positive cocci surface proteins LPxTG domain-containing protein n=1 Tax=Actinorhabdospora filicis TaxID=1785913 RepID=A0A9W6SPW9_9ACTN|nr:prealbumin-like fold domain-containing protein [Actinorhabdospora filicis]GLZ79962.1 hypothetical protein Afil01_47690 [Actinorhabdospora filicis]
MPKGYVLPDPAVFGPVTVEPGATSDDLSLTATNKLKPGVVRLLKKSTDGKVLAGAVFRLWRETNGRSGLQMDADTPVGEECVTDAQGRCDFGSVSAGTYYLEEVAAPDGYLTPDPGVSGPYEVGGVHGDVEVTRTNQRRPELPPTGPGMPVLSLLAIGLTLVGGGLVLRRARRRS